ncbi:MAG TPA: transcription elongation factor GreB [Myxococcales bacterium LLY-WYZ-16_1]|jgi:transcription elongation factor GreB|nr:transcription elongation factor GreB [Myxococcales bacterium LLY-WYZ-16_1]
MSRPITPEGYARFEKELQRLWHEDRPKIVQEVSDAAALGDRSENAEYIFGKKKLREIDKRMKYLSELLERLTVIDPAANAKDRVDFGATVEVEDEEGRVRTYQIVGEDEVDAKAGRISMKSPVGKSLLNQREGDNVLVDRPAGEIELVIRSITYG